MRGAPPLPLSPESSLLTGIWAAAARYIRVTHPEKFPEIRPPSKKHPEKIDRFNALWYNDNTTRR